MKKTSLALIIIGTLISLFGLMGWMLRSQSQSGFFIGIIEPAPSLDGKIMNFLLQPSMIIAGILVIIFGIYLRRKK